MLAKSLANLPNDYAAVRAFHIDGVSHGRNSRSRSQSRLTNDTRECFGSAWTRLIHTPAPWYFAATSRYRNFDTSRDFRERLPARIDFCFIFAPCGHDDQP